MTTQHERDEPGPSPIPVNIRYKLHIEVEWEASGDYMRNAMLEEFLSWAQKHSHNLQVLIKEGGQEPKPVRSRITVGEITINPKKS